jgi:hypothetical protein
MTKFEDMDDPGFKAIVGELLRWIKAFSVPISLPGLEFAEPKPISQHQAAQGS